MSVKRWAGVALMVMATAPIEAEASTAAFDFSGPTANGRLALSYELDPNTAAVLGASPNTHDPLGSYVITGVTGTFSDPALHITNASITGLVPLNEVLPEPSNM